MQVRRSALVDRPAELVTADLRMRLGGAAFALDIEFDSPGLTRAAGGLFENACSRTVDAFVQRALDTSPHRPPAV